MAITPFRADEVVTRGGVNSRLAEIDDLFKVYTATIPVGGWNGSSAPYTQTVVVEGIKNTDTPVIDAILSSNTETALQESDSWGYVSKITTNNNSITATCLEYKPEVSINIQIKL